MVIQYLSISSDRSIIIRHIKYFVIFLSNWEGMDGNEAELPLMMTSFEADVNASLAVICNNSPLNLYQFTMTVFLSMQII